MSALRLDPRSEPKCDQSYSSNIWFRPVEIWKQTKAGNLSVKLKKIPPEHWIRKTLKMEDPKQFERAMSMVQYKWGDVMPRTAIAYSKLIKKKPNDIPPVMFVQDAETKKIYFIDGNHRLIGAWLVGVERVPCYLWDLDELLNTKVKGKPLAHKQ